MYPIRVSGHLYSHQDVSDLRDQVIEWRNKSMDQWPEAIPFTTAATHLVGFLYGVMQQYPGASNEDRDVDFNNSRVIDVPPPGSSPSSGVE